MDGIRHLTDLLSEWITTGEAARLLQVGSISTVERWAREGKLRYRRTGGEQGRVQIERASVERLLHSGDLELLAIQRSDRALDELNDFGLEMTPDEMDDLEAHRTGRLPWQKSK